MSNEENIESMETDDYQLAASVQQSNRRDQAPCQLNTARRRQLLNTKSNMTKSFPEASSSRVNVIHNKLNSTEDSQKVTSKSYLDISLSSPEENTDNRAYNSPSLRSYRGCNDIDDDDDGDDDAKVMNKSDDSDDDIKVDDGMFRVAGFIDDNGGKLEVDVDILRANYMNSRVKRPFVDLYTKQSQTQDRKDTTMLLLESYNGWLKGYNARNKFEQQQQKQTHVEHASSPPPKQTFADRMKGNSTASSPQEKEKDMYAQLTDINNSPRLGGEDKSVGEELNNSTASISSPVAEKEEKIFNRAQDFPDLYSRTAAIARELRSPAAATYSNRSRTNQSPAAASSSNIVLDISTGERWDPNTAAWTNRGKAAKQKQQQQANNDLNKPNNNDQQKAAADEKVQCPICQRSFSVAKVESHAAQCFQFPMETRSNNNNYQDTSNKTVTSSRDTAAALNNSVDLTGSDDEEWEKVRSKANKRKGNWINKMI